jgi:hypothetical protein
MVERLMMDSQGSREQTAAFRIVVESRLDLIHFF